MNRSDDSRRGAWLLLIHQLPPTPPYFRVKIGRHLARIGAIAIKNSVYALPATPQTREDFAWVYREITGGGGEASVCEARLVEGLSDEQLEALFHTARNADYEALTEELRAAQKAFPKRGALSAQRREELETNVARLKKRLAEIAASDFFGATGRVTTDGLLRGLDARLHEAGGAPGRPAGSMRVEEVRGRTWVDLKDEKFGRAEKPGVARLVAGIALTQKDDEARLSRGAALLDDLYESFTAPLP
ncbi:MAG: Chromate resistance protein ChrB [Byssovorax sp.]